MSKRAIVVVDFQNEYLSTGKLPLVGIEPALENAARLIAAARANGDLLIHVRHEFATPDAPVFVPGSDGVQIIPAVAPVEGEPVVVKHYPNSFRDTGLKPMLDERGVEELVVIGAMSHMCVEATSRAAADFGCPVTVVHDACATMDLEFGGTVVPAAHVHATAMATLAFGYAAITTTDAYLADCRGRARVSVIDAATHGKCGATSHREEESIMRKVFIIGGSGKVARRLAQQLVARGHEPRSLYRKPEQAGELEALGAAPVEGNLLELDADGLAQRMAGSDVVVFSAGAGGKGGVEMIDAIDGRGLELAVAAARQAGIQRFLLVSAFPESFRGKEVSETFEHYMAVKKLADVHLAESDLDWVILRPGTLLDAPGTGKVRTGLAIPYGEVPRDDVAATLLEIIEHPAVNRIIVELTEGDVPVAESVARLAGDD